MPVALLTALGICLWRLTITDAITGDVAMYLQCGRLILDGQTIYVDFFDLNPPLVFFISVLPAALAKISGWPLLLCGNIACGALSIFSLLFSAVILKSAGAVFDSRLRAALLLAQAIIAAFVTYDFGQREHLLMLVWLPFFFLRFGRVNGVQFPTALALPVGFLAGLGICFKPYFLLLPALLELSLLLVRRSPKNIIAPEMLGLLAAFLAYALGLALLPPASREYLFGYLMPLLSAGYSAFDKADAIVVLSPVWVPTLALVALSIVVFLGWRLALRLRPDGVGGDGKSEKYLAIALLLQMAVGFALIQIQHKGWCYHGIPMMVSSLLLLALALSGLARIIKVPTRLQFVGAFLCVLVSAVYSCMWLNSVHTRLHTEWETVVPRLAPPGTRVAYLDTTDTPWFVQSALHEIWPGTRYLWLYSVPIYENLLARGKVERAVVDKEMLAMVAAMTADLEKYRTPLVVLKTKGCYGLPPQFDMQQYLNRYGLQNALAHYELAESSATYLYLRRRH